MKIIKKQVILVVLAIEALAVLMFLKEKFFGAHSLHEIERPKADEMSSLSDLTLHSSYGYEDITVTVKPEDRSRQEALNLIEKAREEIQERVFNNNLDADYIMDDLVIEESYVKGKVKAEWSFDNPEIIDGAGKLHLENITGPEIINASCTLKVGDISEVYAFPIRVMPPNSTTQKGFEFLLKEALAGENDKTESSVMKLPDRIGDTEVTWENKKQRDWILMGVLGFLAGFLVIFGQKEDEKKKEKERMRELEEDYPEIVSNLSLYVGAGITVKSALLRIGEGYKRKLVKGGEVRAGYENILQCIRQMSDGKGELESIREFGKRAGHKNYRKLSLLLTQNLRKGGTALGESLEKEEHNAFEERKLRAKIAGEEASTKLLLPMMGLLGIVVVVLVFPAFMGIGM